MEVLGAGRRIDQRLQLARKGARHFENRAIRPQDVRLRLVDVHHLSLLDLFAETRGRGCAGVTRECGSGGGRHGKQ
jgi:hypothetical protein